MVTLHSTVHDSSISLLGDTLLCNLGVDPIWESPHLGVDGSKFHGATCIVLDRLLECRVELRIVKEDIWVMVPSVEMSLDGLDGLDDTIQLLISCQHHKRRIRSRFRGIRLQASRHKDLVVVFTNFPTRENPLAYLSTSIGMRSAYLMAGGAPAGIKIPTPDLGCRTNSTNINTTTMHGKRRTTPRGIEMLELPFNLNGRLKNANLELVFGFVLTSSSIGTGADEVGILLRTLCTKPIDVDVLAVRWENVRYRGCLPQVVNGLHREPFVLQ